MQKEFLDYFTEQVDYPNIAANPLPINVLYSYISHSFLDGFINYAEVEKAFVINRYTDWDELPYPDESCPKTKLEYFEELTQKPENSTFRHTKFREFHDDVIILSSSKIQKGHKVWLYFSYDCDVSDCAIGRFITEDNDEEVINLFSSFVNYYSENNYYLKGKAREIPLHFFRGKWLGF